MSFYNEAICNPFSFKGRTTRKGMWVWGIISLIFFGIVYLISIISGSVWVNVFQIIPIYLFWATAVRRLHDHNLSGNWLFFLCPVGIALMYMVYVLDLDVSVERVVEKIHKTGPLNWLLAAAAWFFVSGWILFYILFLCIGMKQDNMFGPNPYPAEK